MGTRPCLSGRRDEGLTLIEVLVACAVLLVVIYLMYRTFVTGNEYISGSDRRLAAINLSKTQFADIRTTPTSKLPPEELVVSRNAVRYSGRPMCAIRLSRADILGDSLKIISDGRSLSREEYAADCARGTLYLSPEHAGRRVRVEYIYRIGVRRQSVRIPESTPYKVSLLSRPVARVVSVRCADGELDVDGVDSDTGTIFFRGRDAGKSAMIEYVSGDFETLVHGRYRIEPSGMGSSGVKEITLTQKWRDNGHDRQLSFGYLRSN